MREYCAQLACSVVPIPNRPGQAEPTLEPLVCDGTVVTRGKGAATSHGAVVACVPSDSVVCVRFVPHAGRGVWLSVLTTGTGNQLSMWHCAPKGSGTFATTAAEALEAPRLCYSLRLGQGALFDVDWLPIPLNSELQRAAPPPRVGGGGDASSKHAARPLALCTLVRASLLVHAVAAELVPEEPLLCTSPAAGITQVEGSPEQQLRSVRWSTDGTVAGTRLVALAACGSCVVFRVVERSPAGVGARNLLELVLLSRLRPRSQRIAVPTVCSHPPLGILSVVPPPAVTGFGDHDGAVVSPLSTLSAAASPNHHSSGREGAAGEPLVGLAVAAGRIYGGFTVRDFRNVVNVEFDDDATALAVAPNGVVVAGLNNGSVVRVSPAGKMLATPCPGPLISRPVFVAVAADGRAVLVGTQHGHIAVLTPGAAPRVLAKIDVLGPNVRRTTAMGDVVEQTPHVAGDAAIDSIGVDYDGTVAEGPAPVVSYASFVPTEHSPHELVACCERGGLLTIVKV